MGTPWYETPKFEVCYTKKLTLYIFHCLFWRKCTFSPYRGYTSVIEPSSPEYGTELLLDLSAKNSLLGIDPWSVLLWRKNAGSWGNGKVIE